jgi:hypothetical protein
MNESPASEKRINIPLAVETHQALRQQAGSLGVTMYELAAKAVEAAIENRTVSVNVDPSLGDVRTDEAVAAIGGDPDAPASIARHYMNLNKPHLAAVMATFAAERTGEAGDHARASRELTRFAGERGRLSVGLRIALLERALTIHNQNLVARNLLGQHLYFDKQYSRAIEHLVAVRDRDNRARLFHGFAVLRLALEAGDRTRAKDGRDEVVEALEAWSFGNRDPKDRLRWIRQLAELDASSPDFAHTVDELIEYANMNSDWKEPVSRADVATARERLNSMPDQDE